MTSVRWQRLGDKAVGILAALLTLSLVIVLVFAYQAKEATQELIVSGNRHHTQTSKQDSVIIAQNKVIIALTQDVRNAQITNKGTLTDISSLESEVATVIEGLPSADSTLSAEAVALRNDLTALCEAVGADCQTLPSGGS